VHTADPQTLAYAFNDSPAGLAAWILERRRLWSDHDGDVFDAISRDDLLAGVTLYWMGQSIGTSMRYYFEQWSNPVRIVHDRTPELEAPTAIAVMGLQFGYLLGGSILIETVFSWPGTGFLLNSAIFQRDLPLLQGTILVLALFFVFLNLVVDVIQAAIDPRIKRA